MLSNWVGTPKERIKKMATTYEDITTLIPNTTMRKKFVDGIFKNYRIAPIDGYVLHDKERDETLLMPEYDEELGEYVDVEVFVRGYARGSASCAASYAFTPVNIDLDGNAVTAYGAREFCAVPETDVPADRIFSVTPPTEVM